LQGVFEGIGEQIQHDLLPHVPVHVSGCRERRAVDNELYSRTLTGRAEDAGEVRCEGGKIGRFEHRLEAARLDARKIEQSIDQLQEAGWCDGLYPPFLVHL
jgi:hypothetical protein